MRIAATLFALFGLLSGAPRAAQAATISIDLSSQTMRVQSARGESYVWNISSGKAGFTTPRGSYKPYSLRRMHYSRKYDNAPMPHSIFFRGGYAIHGTTSVRQLGRPASHGCIRLAPRNAAKLFAMVKAEGANIHISGSPPLGKTLIAKAKKKKHAKAIFANKKHKPAKAMVAKAKHKPAKALHAGKRTQERPLAYAPAHRIQALKSWLADPRTRY